MGSNGKFGNRSLRQNTFVISLRPRDPSLRNSSNEKSVNPGDSTSFRKQLLARRRNRLLRTFFKK
jgi:hypothetical protein